MRGVFFGNKRIGRKTLEVLEIVSTRKRKPLNLKDFAESSSKLDLGVS